MTRWRTSAVAVCAALAAVAAAAQQPGPHIGYVYPAGARQGSLLVVAVGGRLPGATAAHVSGEGVAARVVDAMKGSRQGPPTDLLNKLKALEQKSSAARPRSPTATPEGLGRQAADDALLLAYRQKLANYVGGPLVPAIADVVYVELTVSAEADVGPRELRLETPAGLTNPVTFLVGQLPELSKPPRVDEELLGGRTQNKYREEPKLRPPQPPLPTDVPAVVNGQILPGTADRYRFAARRGEELVIVAAARDLIPYISDAVPGWFQAVVSLSDAEGRELAFADDFFFRPDPVLHFTVPADGEYVVTIRDAIYRGREDFVYRLTIGAVPYLSGVFPLGGRAGERLSLEPLGWNLPPGPLVEDTAGRAPGIHSFQVRQGPLASNPVPLALDALPELHESAARDSAAALRPLPLPVIVNGRIDAADQPDVFRIDAPAAGPLVAEVVARRLGSPLDSVLRLTDAAGKVLGLNDDQEDKAAGLTTHHADAYLRVELPAAGTYFLRLDDAQHKGGREYAYRLRVGRPQPDFALRVTPSSFSLRPGATVPVTIVAVRRDGFDGAIKVAIRDPADGAALAEASIAAGENEAKIPFKVPPLDPDERLSLVADGEATIDGQRVAHPALPAEDMTQAFEYRHLVPAQELRVALVGKFVLRPSARLKSRGPVRVLPGETATVRLELSPRSLATRYRWELRKPPAGVTLLRSTPLKDGVELVLAVADDVKPGLRGNLGLTAVRNAPPAAEKEAERKWPLPSLPSIAFEVKKPPQPASR